jgi:sulfide:quinone oxidoreductase
MREARINHLGKLMFQWVYWHVLLSGRDIPGLGAEMSMSGKHAAPTAKEER